MMHDLLKTLKLLNPQGKSCGLKNIRTRVKGALRSYNKVCMYVAS